MRHACLSFARRATCIAGAPLTGVPCKSKISASYPLCAVGCWFAAAKTVGSCDERLISAGSTSLGTRRSRQNEFKVTSVSLL